MSPYFHKVLFSVYLLSSCVFATTESDVGNANDYIDEVLQNLRETEEFIGKMDPLHLPDVTEGNFQISDGVVNGLSSLHRNGDCTLTYENDVATISGEVAVEDVTMHMNYRAKAGFFWIKGIADARVDHLAVHAVISIKDAKPYLDSFKVANLGTYKITKITGASVMFNWLLKLISNAVAKNYRGKIIDALETQGANAVRDVLAKVQVPNMF